MYPRLYRRHKLGDFIHHTRGYISVLVYAKDSGVAPTPAIFSPSQIYPLLTHNSALSREPPAAPRMVLWPSSTNL